MLHLSSLRRHRQTLLLALLATLSAACASPTRGAALDGPVGAWEVIGTSAEGRPVRARSLGRGGRRVAVIAGIHGDETEGLRHVEELAAWLAGAPAQVRLIEDVSPDGTAHRTRTTASGVDPNRNWPAKNFTPDPSRGPRPLSEPEVAAAHADLVRFAPEMVIVLHSTRRGPFVNFDGPAAGLAEVFAEAAGAPWKVVPDMGYGTPGSFGSWMGIDRNVPTLTVEFLRGDRPEATGPALERAVRATLASFASGETAAAHAVR